VDAKPEMWRLVQKYPVTHQSEVTVFHPAIVKLRIPQESWDRDAVQIPLDRASAERVDIRRRSWHCHPGIDPSRSR
jgi:hypothetical protein